MRYRMTTGSGECPPTPYAELAGEEPEIFYYPDQNDAWFSYNFDLEMPANPRLALGNVVWQRDWESGMIDDMDLDPDHLIPLRYELSCIPPRN